MGGRAVELCVRSGTDLPVPAEYSPALSSPVHCGWGRGAKLGGLSLARGVGELCAGLPAKEITLEGEGMWLYI